MEAPVLFSPLKSSANTAKGEKEAEGIGRVEITSMLKGG